MDSLILYPPGAPSGASGIQLGSWLKVDPPADYGAAGLLQAQYAENALVDGGQLSFQRAGVRKMTFALGVHAPWGVNQLQNPGFELGASHPYWVDGSPSGFAASFSTSGSAYVGSWFGILQGSPSAAPQLTGSPVALARGEPFMLAIALWQTAGNATANMFLGARFYDASMIPGGFLAGDPIPGYQPATYLIGMAAVATSGWTLYGGMVPAASVPSSAVAAALLFGIRVPAATVAVAFDAAEFRTASRERATREWESQLRGWAQPGAHLDVQPDGVPSSEAVRFDVLAGRWEPDYQTPRQRIGWRDGSLRIETQPYGYWPTWILLASVASLGPAGVASMSISTGPLIGDTPNGMPARLTIEPNHASYYGASPWSPDMLAWSFGGGGSFSALLSGGSWTAHSGGGGGVVGDKFAPASQAAKVVLAASMTGLWWQAFDTTIASTLEPAYRGRFRAFALTKLLASQAPWQITLDAFRDNAIEPALASSAPVASAWSTLAGVSPSPGYTLTDVGEVTLPPGGASGLQGSIQLRLWTNAPSGVPTPHMQLAGIYLLPVDGPAGILPKGLHAPSLIAGWEGVLDLNPAGNGEVMINTNFPDVAPMLSIRSFYRGVLPRVSASTGYLNVLVGQRFPNLAGATEPLAITDTMSAAVSVQYRPTFQFLKGL